MKDNQQYKYTGNFHYFNNTVYNMNPIIIKCVDSIALKWKKFKNWSMEMAI